MQYPQASEGLSRWGGPIFSFQEKKLEARGGIEPPIWVLQTHALPLGDRASNSNYGGWQEMPDALLATRLRQP